MTRPIRSCCDPGGDERLHRSRGCGHRITEVLDESQRGQLVELLRVLHQEHRRWRSAELSELGPRFLASAALSAMRSSPRHWIATGQRLSLPTLVETCFDRLASGLADID
jgi:hypothetical protein